MKNCTFADHFVSSHGHCYALLDEAPFALPIYCSGGGRCRVDGQPYRYDGMQRGKEEFSFWQYTISGTVALETGTESVRLCAGEGMLLSVPEEHCYYLPPEAERWDSVYQVFGGRDCRRLVSDIRGAFGSHFQVAPSAETLELAREWLELLAAKWVVSAYESAAFGSRFLLTLAGELARANAVVPPGIEQARLLVKRDPGTSVEKMCRASGYSRLYFERLFKRSTGSTPAAYLAEQRLARALELLRHTTLPVAEVAGLCGFRDCAYFCRVFRKRFLRSPGKWRGH